MRWRRIYTESRQLKSNDKGSDNALKRNGSSESSADKQSSDDESHKVVSTKTSGDDDSENVVTTKKVVTDKPHIILAVLFPHH